MGNQAASLPVATFLVSQNGQTVDPDQNGKFFGIDWDPTAFALAPQNGVLRVAIAPTFVGTLDHNSLANLTVGDPHPQYFFIAGRAGGQTANGGSAASQNLIFSSTANAVKGFVQVGGVTGFRFDETTTRLGIGVTSPAKPLHVRNQTTGAVANRGSVFAEGAIATGVSDSAFVSASPFLSFVVGNQADSDYGAPGNGGLYAGARRGTGGAPPTNAPFTGLSIWDFGLASFAPGGLDTGRVLYFGGGGWAAPDVNQHQFYCASAYTEATDTGVLAYWIDSNGRTAAFFAMREAGDITPAALGVGPTNNYAPAGLATTRNIRQDMSAAGVLTGLLAQADGSLITIYNISAVGVNTMTLNHEDAGSAAANRFILSGLVSLVVPAGGSVTLWYDLTSTRWRVRS